MTKWEPLQLNNKWLYIDKVIISIYKYIYLYMPDCGTGRDGM